MFFCMFFPMSPSSKFMMAQKTLMWFLSCVSSNVYLKPIPLLEWFATLGTFLCKSLTCFWFRSGMSDLMQSELHVENETLYHKYHNGNDCHPSVSFSCAFLIVFCKHKLYYTRNMENVSLQNVPLYCDVSSYLQKRKICHKSHMCIFLQCVLYSCGKPTDFLIWMLYHIQCMEKAFLQCEPSSNDNPKDHLVLKVASHSLHS